MKKWLLMFFVCALAVSGVTAQDAPRSVIVDTDMTSDDWMAILYLLNRPDFRVEAITVTGSGFADCDAGVQVALGLLAFTDYGDVPVSCWQDAPWRGGEIRVPAAWRTTLDSIQALELPEGGEPAAVNAVELFTSTVQAADAPITVLALGPLTNIAAALEATPDLVSQIDRMFVMGGAVDAPGSGVSDENTTAEWNIYADPPAARVVFESGVPITLIGLDATNDAPVTADVITQMRDAAQSPDAEFVVELLSEGSYFWDQLATAVMTNPELVTLETRDVTVIDTAGAEDGRTKPVGNGPDITVASAPDVEAFYELFIATLNS